MFVALVAPSMCESWQELWKEIYLLDLKLKSIEVCCLLGKFIYY